MNPYQPPAAFPPDPPIGTRSTHRNLFLLAAAGAGLASVYWAGLTLLLLLGASTKTGAATQMFLPLLLIALYAYRGFQLFKGDPAAAKRILWLHGVGGVVAIMQMSTFGGLLAVLQGIKLAIHIFGGVTAYLVVRAHA